MSFPGGMAEQCQRKTCINKVSVAGFPTGTGSRDNLEFTDGPVPQRRIYPWRQVEWMIWSRPAHINTIGNMSFLDLQTQSFLSGCYVRWILSIIKHSLIICLLYGHISLFRVIASVGFASYIDQLSHNLLRQADADHFIRLLRPLEYSYQATIWADDSRRKRTQSCEEL